MSTLFNLQGHRGARNRKPENTLPSFEAAFDAGVRSVETDVHLTRDGVAVLHHDALLGQPPQTLLSTLTLAELRRCRAPSPNPLPPGGRGQGEGARFPEQDAGVTPLAERFARDNGLDPYGIPTLDDFLRFAAFHAEQMAARPVLFDLELKRVPFHPETIGDGFDGISPGLLEQRVVEAVRRAGVAARTTVRSFDHRCVRLLRRMEPELTGAVLVAEMAPVAPAELLERAEAQIYCPNYLFLDEMLVRQVHAAGGQVLPWTVNRPEHWQRLLDWGVDGLTTDVPDHLAVFLRDRGVAF